MSYESIYDETNKAIDSVDQIKEDEWASFNEGYTSPEYIDNVSQEINKLLIEDSDYLQQARESSYEQYEQMGMLESDFWESTGEVKAIDAVGQVAEGNVQSDLYEQFLQNEIDYNEYSKSYISHMDSMNSGFKIEGMNYFNLLEQEVNRVNFGYDLENQWYGQQYNLDYIDAMQGYNLEMQAKTFDYNTQLADQTYGYYLKGIELDHAVELDQMFMGLAAKQSQTTTALSNIETLQYNHYFYNVISSNLEPEAKEDLIANLYSKFDARQKELGTWEQVANNPYTYEDSYKEGAKPPPKGDDIYRTGPWYTGGMSLEAMNDFVITIDEAIRDELDTKDRHKWPVAEDVASIRYWWPIMMEKNPKEAKAIQKWFTSVVQSGVFEDDEDAWQDVTWRWLQMMEGLSGQLKPIYESVSGGPGEPDDTTVIGYATYSINDSGNIIYSTYKYDVKYCNADKSECYAEDPTPVTSPDEPTFTSEFKPVVTDKLMMQYDFVEQEYIYEA